MEAKADQLPAPWAAGGNDSKKGARVLGSCSQVWNLHRSTDVARLN